VFFSLLSLLWVLIPVLSTFALEGFVVPVVEGFAVPVVEVLLSHFVVSTVDSILPSLACGLSFGKLSTSPYDRDQTLEV
jgi:hypothetical protein